MSYRNSCILLLLFLSAFASQETRGQFIPDFAFNNGSSGVDGQHLVRVHRDEQDNIYQCGLFSGPSMDVDPSVGVTLLNNSGGYDGFVAKYSPAGALLWAFKIGGTAHDGIYSVKTDAAGNVYVGGFFNSTVDFNPSSGVYNLTSNGGGGSNCGVGSGGDAFIAKYTASGQFLWAFQIGGSYCYDAVLDLCVSPEGTVYATGNVNMGNGPVDFDPSPAVHTLNGDNGYGFLAKYTTAGQYVWAFNFGGAYANSGGRVVRLDHQQGSLYVSGYARGLLYDMDPDPGSSYYLSNNPEDGFVARYDTSMNFVFAFNIPSSGEDGSLDMDIDERNIYVTGRLWGNNIDFDPGPGTTSISTQGMDAYAAAYTKAGQFKWASKIGSSGLDQGWGIHVSGNRVLVTGEFMQTVDFDPSAAVYNITSNGGSDGYVQWLDTMGNFVCANNIGGPGNDISYKALGYGSNHVILTGSFQQSLSMGAQNISSNGQADSYLSDMAWNGCGIIDTTAANDTVINKYAAVYTYEPCTNTFTVDTATYFNPGDTILIVQMKGAVIDSSNTSAFGIVSAYGNSGNYEYNVIASKTGNVLTLKYKMARSYTIPDGKVQFVKVPRFQQYTVGQTHTALPWNGEKGGVFAVIVDNTLTLDGDINVKGKGFRGGQPLMSTAYGCNRTDYFYPAAGNYGGQKGEGIATLSAAKGYGRGPLANGGGGGNDHNAGGGGGGNAAAGGLGGNQYNLSGCGTIIPGIGGIGGHILAYSSAQNKVFLGGGGGAGHGSDLSEKAGGTGGGMIIINAGTINRISGTIGADGADAAQCNAAAPGCQDDGTGGGGGGGSVLLRAGSYSGAIPVHARGGKGANTWVSANTSEVAPGGGGGGGIIWYSQNLSPSGILNMVGGGANGTLPQFSNNNWGAQPGLAGQVLGNLPPVFPVDTFYHYLTVDFNDSATGCHSFSFEDMSVSSDTVVTWSWDFGGLGSSSLADPSFSFPGNGVYQVTLSVTDNKGCVAEITKTITINMDLVADFSDSVISCLDFVFHDQSSSSSSVNSWSWDFGDEGSSSLQHPSFTFPGYGSYPVTLTVTDSNGCQATVTELIDIPYRNFANAGNDTVVCEGSSAVLHASGGISYSWYPPAGLSNPGAAITTAHITGNTLYVVTVEDEDGCRDTDTVQVSVSSANVSITPGNNMIISCDGMPIQLEASGALYYSWSPGIYCDDSTRSDPRVNPPATTLFTVTGTSPEGCKSEDTITIVSHSGVTPLFMPNAFSPNGDGLNDDIKPYLLCGLKMEEFAVFNRWGQCVFLSKDPDKGWDGYHNNQRADIDTYFYIVRCSTQEGHSRTFKGDFSLLR